MINFTVIRWKNFLSTGNIFTEVNLNENNMTLIVGENGAGKSTILDALTFGLFNKPFRRINKPQLVNSITGKHLLVEVEFSIGADNYKIIRGIKPAVFELWCNDRMVNQDSAARDYQDVLEKQILKINYKSFCQVVVLGSASFVPFMQLPALQRREIIEDLLDLEIFTTMNLLLKDKIAQNNDDLQKAQNDKKIAEAQIEMLKSHLDSVQSNNEKQIEEKKGQIDSANALIDDAKREIESIIETGRDLKARLFGYELVREKLTKLDTLKVQLQSKISQTEKTITFFHDHDNCPTCKQGIDHTFKDQTLKTKTGQIDELRSGLAKLEDERQKIIEMLEESNRISSKLQDLNLQLSQLNVKVSNWNENINNWKKEIAFIQGEKEQVNVNKIAELEETIKTLDASLHDLHDRKAVLAAAASILKDGGIKARIIKQYIPIINKLINKYLSAMDFFVNFELNEQFDEKIKSRFRDEFSYASFSEGEKMRINLAILFTWRAISKLRSSVNTNLLIMDEVFDSSLDANGTEEFMKILQSLTVDTNTFIISHKTENITDKFEKIIVFEKHKNFSKVAA